MPSIPITTITSAGVSVPAYSDVLSGMQGVFQSIYGSDIYIDPDSQDGQFLAALAAAINDVNLAVQACYLSFSPTYSQGAGLSSLVKLNGLRRQIPSYSTAGGTVVGQVGTVITNGVVKDVNGNLWNLPASVVIPAGGQISVTITAQTLGAITAAIGDINSIYTPTYGWQSFTNTSAAVTGSPAEIDSTLKQRQSISTATPASAIVDSISAAVGNVSGVTRFKVFENDTTTTDANGIPAHSIAVVTYGGAVADIASAIQSRKPPGTPTYGTTSYTAFDSYGLPITINYFVLTLVPIYITITGTALTGFVSTTESLIQQALVQHLNNLSIGDDVYYMSLTGPATLKGTSAITATGLTQAELDVISKTFNITSMKVGTAPSPTGTADLAILFNQAAQGVVTNIGVTIA